MLRNPAADFNLLKLKAIATTGSEFGPLFDQGVLSVIEQIERTGRFAPNPEKRTYGIHVALTKNVAGILAL